MKHVQLFTHKGWFGICPVYVADLGTDCPHLTPRQENWFFNSLFFISHWGFLAYFAFMDICASMIDRQYDAGFPIWVTGELLIPYRYEYEEDDEGPLL